MSFDAVTNKDVADSAEIGGVREFLEFSWIEAMRPQLYVHIDQLLAEDEY